jgi:acyl-CoA thioester hydrolase
VVERGGLENRCARECTVGSNPTPSASLVVSQLKEKMPKSHTFSVRVYFEDTDTGGIVYYANYLKFSERARTEFLRDFGFSHFKIMKEQEVMFVVRSCVLNCLAPAHLDDVLEIKTHLKAPGHAKLALSQVIMREDQIIATLEVVLACVNLKGKPVKMDDNLRQLLITYGSDLER